MTVNSTYQEEADWRIVQNLYISADLAAEIEIWRDTHVKHFDVAAVPDLEMGTLPSTSQRFGTICADGCGQDRRLTRFKGHRRVRKMG